VGTESGYCERSAAASGRSREFLAHIAADQSLEGVKIISGINQNEGQSHTSHIICLNSLRLIVEMHCLVKYFLP
jgi:hypothetical protein